MSARQLIEPTLPRLISDLIAITEISPESLSLEVTERVLTDHPEIAENNLMALRALGIRIAVDDFGSGFASLRYLQNLRVDQIKIDRQLTDGLSIRARDTAVIRSTIDLAHELGLSVIAEGVETPQQLEALAEFGCDYAQGFHIAHPKPAGDLSELLLRPDLSDLVVTRNPAPPASRSILASARPNGVIP